MTHPPEYAAAEVIAYHGWGFDRTCWASWSDLFDSHQMPLTAFDRGYFGAAHTPRFTGDRYRILMAHSYGLHLCPVEQLQQANLLIIFGSFIDFHPQGDRERRRSQRVLQQMIRECEQQPETVLNHFYTRCNVGSMEAWHAASKPSSSPEKGRPHAAPLHLDAPSITFHPPSNAISFQTPSQHLVADLRNLNVACIDIARLKSIPKIIIFHGNRDQIVSLEKGQELFEQLRNNADYFMIEGAGHALPFTHRMTCWDIVRRALQTTIDG